ncbi:MAG: L,D-transpeptidase family protein [Candidatus Brocadiales bacterium]|nr:L,D-transpeptidase family protein [Candidatus Bathyanammoxibius sp.]
MKNYRIFVHLSGAIVCMSLFLLQQSQLSDNLLYAESSRSISSGSMAGGQVEEIRREDIIFRTKPPEAVRERSRPSERLHPRRQTIRPRALPTTTGTVVSRPRRQPLGEQSFAHAAKRKTGSRSVKHAAGRESLQETIDNAYEYLLRGKKEEARNLYSKALFIETSRERREIIKKHLDVLNKELVFSPKTGPGSVTYEVKSGDNLTKIAKKFNTTPGLLMRINRKKDTRLRVNEPLKVLTGTTSVLVDKKNFTLTLLIDGYYVKEFPIGTGKDDSTPEGTFFVESRLKNPVWYSPEGVYPYGHPKNILGTRWLGFKNKPGTVGYGVHGTTKPETIGTESSNGCIRMRNGDVEELYDFVTPNTKVTIKS